MPDDSSVTVIIAPGRHYTLSPHPSGLPLPPLVLESGAAVTVAREEAVRLFEAGTVLHPLTLLPKPAATDRHAGKVTVSVGGRAFANPDEWLMALSGAEREAGEAELRRLNAEIEERGRTVRPHYAGEQIDGAAGREPSASPWYLNTPPDPHDNR